MQEAILGIFAFKQKLTMQNLVNNDIADKLIKWGTSIQSQLALLTIGEISFF